MALVGMELAAIVLWTVILPGMVLRARVHLHGLSGVSHLAAVPLRLHGIVICLVCIPGESGRIDVLACCSVSRRALCFPLVWGSYLPHRCDAALDSTALCSP